MRKIFTLLFACMCVVGYSQEFEIGAKGGVNFFHGDLVLDIVDMESIGFGGGLFARYHFDPRFDVRASVNYGLYSSSDLTTPERTARGFSSESTLIDFTIGAEWNLMGVSIYQNQKRHNSNFTPYLHLGVGANLADVTVTTAVDSRALDPLDLAKEYPNFSMVVPMGVGLRYNLGKIVIGLEGTLTAGLNDYLDGISKSANSTDNDWYTSAGITVAYRIGEVANSDMSNEGPVEYLDGDAEYYDEDIDEDN